MNLALSLPGDRRLDAARVRLVFFDMQLDLLPMIVDGGDVLNNCCWLADFAARQSIDTVFVEHEKLGALAPRLAALAPGAARIGTCRFSLCEAPDFPALAAKPAGTQWVLAGIETHIALLQSAFALAAAGDDVFIVDDATSSRAAADRDRALERLGRNGIEIVTREMLFFETLRQSEREDYMDLSLRFLDGRYMSALAR